MSIYEYKGKIARISHTVNQDICEKKATSTYIELYFKIDKANIIKRTDDSYITCPTADEDGITLGVKLCKLYKIKDDHYLRIFANIDNFKYIISNLKPDVNVEIVFNSDNSPDSCNTAEKITLINEF